MHYAWLLTTLFIFSIGAAQKPAPLQTEVNNKTAPHINITEFKVLNEDLPVDSLLKLPKVELPNERNTFSISFAPTIQTDTFVYYYKLDGAEKTWTQASKPTTVNYTLLPPGSYLFLVKAENPKTHVSTAVTQLSILIRIPFWLSWWFILLGCLLFTATIYFFHRQSVNRILAIEALRQKVARDLHDDMGSTLSTINILSAMAKNKLTEDPAKTSEYLTKISNSSSRMMEAMDDIVWSINPANDSMDKIIARMRGFATEVLEAKDINLTFSVDPAVEQVYLDMEQRRDLFLIFKEAINNAAKYACATQVTIHMGFEKSFLQLTVQDNGVGFIVNEADSGNGLTNMQKRALQLHGEINLQSQPGKGTSIQLQIPVA